MKENSQIKNDTSYLDTIRALATFGVIVIHVATPSLKMNFDKNQSYWLVSNVIDSAVRGIVPVFLMLTGATLLVREYTDLKAFYIKRFQRVFVPFLFWMVLYWFYFWLVLPAARQPHGFVPILKWAWNLFVSVGISKHFWYFYMILVLYLFVPFLSGLLAGMKRNTLLIIPVGWAILCFLVRDVPKNMYAWQVDVLPGKVLGWIVHGGYLLVGYYIATMSRTTSLQRRIWFGVYVTSIACCAAYTWYFSKPGKMDLGLYSYVSPNSIVQAIAFYMMFRNSVLRNKVLLWIRTQACSYSYGIYLAHVIALSLFFDRGFYWKIAHPLFSIPLVAICAFVLCYVMVFILRRLPFGKYVSG